MYKVYILLIVIFFKFRFSENARILGIIPTASYSHQIVYKPLWNELARRGHKVVVITTDPDNDRDSGVTEINIRETYKIWSPFIKRVSQITNAFEFGQYMRQFNFEISEYELNLPEVQVLLKNKTEHFDLVMVEMFYMPIFGFAEKFKCPLIGLLTLDMLNEMYSFVGSPVHPIAYPDILSTFEQGNMGFWQRLRSTLHQPLFELGFHFHFGMDEKELRLNEQFFGTQLSPAEIRKKLSIVLVNVVPTFNLRPVGPAIINIGGNLHIKAEKRLQKEYQEFLDSASNGAIYFSLGTNVKSHVVPPEMRQAFLDAFRELSYKVLWKFDIVDLPNVPANVKIVEWAPQQDILRHPNIKLFIFQGGLQSYEEAVYNKIPLVGIPFLGDQDSNVQRLVGSGYGVKIDKHNVTKESVKEAIHEVINNPSYKQKITATSELIADQPMTGLEKAVWWTEYVLRHKGAHHLRSPVMDLPFYQYYLLDVLGFLLGCTIVVIVVLYKLCKLIRQILFKTKTKKVKVK